MQKYLEIEDQIEVEKRETQKQIDTLEHDNKSLESRIKSYQDHSKCQLSELLFKTFVFKATKSIVSSESLFHFFATLIPTREYTVNSHLADISLLWNCSLLQTKSRFLVKVIEVWLEMTPVFTDSCCYGITDTFVVSKWQFYCFDSR